TTATDTGSSGTDDLTNSTATAYTGSADTGSTVTIFDNGTSVAQDRKSVGKGTITTSISSEGTHTLTASATDTAGNSSAASCSLLVTIDTTAPSVPGTPDLTTATDTGSSGTDNLTKSTATAYTGSADTGSTVTIFDNGTSVA